MTAKRGAFADRYWFIALDSEDSNSDIALPASRDLELRWRTTSVAFRTFSISLLEAR